MNSMFNSQMQISMMQLFMKLIEKYIETSSGNSGQGLSEGLEQSSNIEFNDFKDLIEQISSQYNVDSDLVQAVVQAESNYDANAVSHAGAQGLMQLMPATAQSLGVSDPFDPVENVTGGVKLLRELLDRYDGNLPLTLAAYNAGPGAVQTYGGIPPYQETQIYVERVTNLYQAFDQYQ
ncbi:MAG: lytic transglycosylase domain-containing protein [Anaerolineaceae bacterium]|nr:lytic transglycosylase domain-containing protein [Anaerolineaceae bacterium]